MDSSKLEKLIKEKLVLFEFEADATQLTALILKLVEKKRLDNPDEKVARFFEPFFKDQALDFVKCVSNALKEDRKCDEIKSTSNSKEMNTNSNLTTENINNSDKKNDTSSSFSGNDVEKDVPTIKIDIENSSVRTKRKLVSEDKSDKIDFEPPKKIGSNFVMNDCIVETNDTIKNKQVGPTSSLILNDGKKKDLQLKDTGNNEPIVMKEKPKRQRIVFDIDSTGEQINKNENHKKIDDGNNSNLPKTKQSSNEGLCNIAKRALGDLANSDRVAQRKARFGMEKVTTKEDEKSRKRKSEVSDSDKNDKSDKVYRLKPPIDKEAYGSVKNVPTKKKKLNSVNSEQNDTKRFSSDCTTKVVLKSDESSSEEEDTNIDEIINNYYSKKPTEENNKDKKNEITVVSQSAFTQHMIPNKVGTRCRFWPQCRNSDDDCPFIHPAKICTNFPYCFYGAHCLYIHPVCKFNGNCLNLNCIYTHISNQPLPLEDDKLEKQNETSESNVCIQLSEEPKLNINSDTLSIIPCSFSGKCKKQTCPYKHPKLCRYGNECNNTYCTFRHLDIQSPEKTLLSTSDVKDDKIIANDEKVSEETSNLIFLPNEE